MEELQPPEPQAGLTLLTEIDEARAFFVGNNVVWRVKFRPQPSPEFQFPEETSERIFDRVAAPFEVPPELLRVAAAGQVKYILEYREAVARHQPWYPDWAFPDFYASWLSLRIRSRSLVDYCSKVQHTTPVDGESFYEHERGLFGFFVTAVAVVESYAYSLYALGSMLKPRWFSPDKAFSQTPDTTAAMWRRHFPMHGVHTSLNELVGGEPYRLVKRVRNIVLHRLSPHTAWGTDDRGEGAYLIVRKLMPGEPDSAVRLTSSLPVLSEFIFEWLGTCMAELDAALAKELEWRQPTLG